MALIKTQVDDHARQCYFKRDLEAVTAATDYLLQVEGTADDHDGEGAPLWYGWALHKAFLAGIRFEKRRRAGIEKEFAGVKEKPPDPAKRKKRA